MHIHILQLFVIILFLVQFTSPATSHAAQPKQGGIMVFGRAADSTFLDPAKFLDNESAMVIENIYDGLVRYKDDSTRIEPALARSWEISPDGRTWTFQLRRGVKFHDGTPFNAQAAAFSFQRKTDPKHPYYREDFGKMDSTLSSINSVDAVDDLTLRITLKEPYAPFLNVLATHSSYIVSPEAVMKWGDDFNKHPVGTGPFAFVEWRPKDRIILEANKTYWNGRPRLDRIIFKVVEDNKVRQLELKAGVLHVSDGISPAERDDLEKRGGFVVDAKPGLNVGYLAMNMDRPPFDKLVVRQAVNHAINKAALIKLHYRNMAVPATNPIPPIMWGYNASLKDYDFNPDKARKLLNSAGFPNGFETTLWAMPVARPYMPDPDNIAEAIRANLEAVGIRARIVSHDWKTYLNKLYAGEHDMAILGWVGTGDPDNFFYHLFDKEQAVAPHASNIAFLRNEAVHAMIKEARRSSKPDQRTAIYVRLQATIHQLAPWTPLAHASQMLARSVRAQDVVQHPTGVVRFHKAWLD